MGDEDGLRSRPGGQAGHLGYTASASGLTWYVAGATTTEEWTLAKK